MSFAREVIWDKKARSKVRSKYFLVVEKFPDLRSQAAPVLLKFFDQSSEDGKIIGQFKSFLARPSKKLSRKEHTNSYQALFLGDAITWQASHRGDLGHGCAFDSYVSHAAVGRGHANEQIEP